MFHFVQSYETFQNQFTPVPWNSMEWYINGSGMATLQKGENCNEF